MIKFIKSQFKNKTQMKRHVKSVLNSNAILDKDRDLICRIAEIYSEKTVYSLSVQKDKFNNNQFITNNGVFSYIKAIDYLYGKTETNEQRFTGVMRRHLIPFMHKEKLAMLNKCDICTHTGIKLTVKNSHVDHVGEYEFSDIINGFMADIDLNKIEYISTSDGDYLKDISIFNEFKKYHDKLAVLEVVYKTWNLTRGKK